MKLQHRLVLCSLFSAAALGTAQSHTKPQMQSTVLWHAGDAGYDTYRIPGIVVASDGTVLAYTNARRHLKDGDWSDSDIMLRRSLDGGKHWTPSQRIAGDSHGVTDNPVAIASKKKGVVHFLYQHDYANIFYMRSTDDGATFSQAIDITSSLEDLRREFPWTVVALGPGHAIELTTGRLLVPVWLAAGKSTGNNRRGHAPSGITTIYSDDGGTTWKHGSLIATNSPEMENPNEWQVIQLADGSVMGNIRTGDKRQRRVVAFSPDGISNWTKPIFDEHLYDPICAAGIVRYDDKRILFTNPDSRSITDPTKPRGLRQNLTLKISEDEGKTWPIAKLLKEGSSGYSDIAVAPDKTIYDLNESLLDPGDKANSVSVFRFNLAWAMKK